MLYPSAFAILDAAKIHQLPPLHCSVAVVLVDGVSSVSMLPSPGSTRSSQRVETTLLLSVLAAATLAIHGYHPYAEDGGLYVAGIERTLNPALFPHDAAFVTAHLHFSIFAPVLATATRWSHLPLASVLLLTYIVATVATFFAAWRIVTRCTGSRHAQRAALALLACWWTLPVAATSLLLMDPYVTARTVCFPLSLLAVSFLADDNNAKSSPVFALLCLLIAAAFHPLMACYAAALIAAIYCVRCARPRVARCVFFACALGLAAMLQRLAPPESGALVAAEKTRYYWFLSQWHWFEYLGIIAPLAIFWTLARSKRLSRVAQRLCSATVLLTATATAVALLFAHESAATHLVARLQPLRSFVLAYALLALIVGIFAYERLTALRAPAWRSRRTVAVVLSALAITMFAVQRASFRASPHVEFPWHEGSHPNPWVQAFLWSRKHTPSDALFALDARYINMPGEDAQTFRAIAQRSTLPDYSKDGGEASITPALAELWLQGANAQKDLSTLSDQQRNDRLAPLKVDWVILHTYAVTAERCPYRNGTVKVCQVHK